MTAYVGWYRTSRQGRRTPWREVCRAPSEAEAWAKLWRYQVEEDTMRDRCVLPAGRHPAEPLGAKS